MKQNRHLDIESGIADYLRFHDRHIAPGIPAPPAPWKDLSEDFARIAEEQRGTSTSTRRRFRPSVGLIAVAAAAAAGLTYLIEIRREPPRTFEAPAKVTQPSRSISTPAAVPRPSAKPDRSVADRNFEVRILAALHRAGADLGDPVDVVLEDGHWKVKAIESTPSRMEALRLVIGTLEGVELVVKSVRPEIDGLGVPAAVTRDAKSPAAVLVFAPQLESYFGSRVELNNAADRAFDRSQTILAHAHALKKLDDQFPSDAELGPAEREILRSMRRDHYRAIAATRAGLETDFALLSAALSIEASNVRQASDPLLAAAARWDHALAVILGGAATHLTQDQLKAELSEAHAALHKAIGDLQ